MITPIFWIVLYANISGVLFIEIFFSRSNSGEDYDFVGSVYINGEATTIRTSPAAVSFNTVTFLQIWDYGAVTSCKWNKKDFNVKSVKAKENLFGISSTVANSLMVNGLYAFVLCP